MAKQPQKPAPPSSSASAPAPYPKDWGKMSKEARASWMKQNRPNRPQGKVVAPVKLQTPTRAAPPSSSAPAPAPAPAPVGSAIGGQGSPDGESRPLVQIDVTQYAVRVGTREPVPCGPEDVIHTVDSELDAWEEQCQSEGTTTEDADVQNEYKD